ncbi:MAG: hypothetical protein HY782_21885 [Chloroflexi bacterium]|nr:hypothetical protein [Chloroflexota bacterium]
MNAHRLLLGLTLGAAALVAVVLAGLAAYAATSRAIESPDSIGENPMNRVAAQSDSIGLAPELVTNGGRSRATAAPTTTDGGLLVGVPLTAAQAPASHADWSWTIRHRDTSVQDRASCSTCHSQSFCATCHRNAPPHPRDILYTHPQVIRAYKDSGRLGCYTYHQNIGCARCHTGNVVGNP